MSKPATVSYMQRVKPVQIVSILAMVHAKLINKLGMISGLKTIVNL